MNKKIIITGATGLIGSRLTEALSNNYEISIFSRDIQKAKLIVPFAHSYIEWDFRNPGKWRNQIEDTYAVIHLAGASIAGKRFTSSYKKIVMESRTVSTENLAEAMVSVKNKPKVFLCASGVNYYGENGDKILTEESSSGVDFLADVCKKWEDKASLVEEHGITRISIRTSPVFSTKDGMLKTLLPLFNLYLGASLGNGKQWLPWIHIDDIVRTYIFLLENQSVSGAVNAASPNPIRMNDFANQLGGVLHRPAFFKVPKILMKLVKGEAADFITASMRVVPQKLEDNGFKFKYPELNKAMTDIIKNKK